MGLMARHRGLGGRCECNQPRPHSSLGYWPPAPEAMPEPVTPRRLVPVLALTQEVVQTLRQVTVPVAGKASSDG